MDIYYADGQLQKSKHGIRETTYDFYARDTNDLNKYSLNGKHYSSSDFGNFIAGFGTGLHDSENAPDMLWWVRVYGDYYAWRKSGYWTDDSSDIEQINEGYNYGRIWEEWGHDWSPECR